MGDVIGNLNYFGVNLGYFYPSDCDKKTYCTSLKTYFILIDREITNYIGHYNMKHIYLTDIMTTKGYSKMMAMNAYQWKTKQKLKAVFQVPLQIKLSPMRKKNKIRNK